MHPCKQNTKVVRRSLSLCVKDKSDRLFLFAKKSEVFSIAKYIKSPISWVGGKGQSREIILKSTPLECTRYVEVFGGGGTILLSKEPHKFEVYNDFNSDLVNMFRCIKERPLSFFKSAGLFPLNSRQEFKMLQDFLERNEPDFSHIKQEKETAIELFSSEDLAQIEKILDGRAEMYDTERASAFYKVIRYSYSSTGKNFGGQPVNLPNVLEDIYAISKRLTNVVIENKDFSDLIKLHDKPGTFMYLDPPYFMTEGFYGGFARNDHIRLYECLANLKYTKFLLSYNGCEFIKELYNQYTIVEFSRLHSMVQRYKAGSQFEELLIANYDINERRRNEPIQLSLFGDDDYERNYLQDYRQKRANNHTFYVSQALRDNK